MKKFLVALALSAVAVTAQAQNAAQDIRTFDVVTITTNVALTYPSSGVIDTAHFDVLDCAVAVAGGASRLVIPKCYAEAAGTNVVYTYPTMTVAAAANGRYLFDPRYGGATDDTNTTASPAVPCRFLKITAAAAGDGKLSCTLRKIK